MKLFVWEDVLRDYTSGMAVAYAENLESALADFPPYIAKQLGAPTTVIDTSDPQPAAFTAFVYGGG